MKTIVAGTRAFDNWALMQKTLDTIEGITEIVSGRAKGADQMGEWYAKIKDLPVKMFPAKWELYGKAAGPIRNRKMAENASALIAVWDGASRGTKNMIETAQKRGLLVYVKRI